MTNCSPSHPPGLPRLLVPAMVAAAAVVPLSGNAGSCHGVARNRRLCQILCGRHGGKSQCCSNPDAWHHAGPRGCLTEQSRMCAGVGAAWRARPWHACGVLLAVEACPPASPRGPLPAQPPHPAASRPPAWTAAGRAGWARRWRLLQGEARFEHRPRRRGWPAPQLAQPWVAAGCGQTALPEWRAGPLEPRS